MNKAIIFALSVLPTAPLFSASHPLSTDHTPQKIASFIQKRTGPIRFTVPTSEAVQSFLKKRQDYKGEKKPLLNYKDVLWQLSCGGDYYDGKLNLFSVEFFKQEGFEHKDEFTGDIFVTYTIPDHPEIKVKLELFPRRIPCFDYALKGGDIVWSSFYPSTFQKLLIEAQKPEDILFSGTPKTVNWQNYEVIESITTQITIQRVPVSKITTDKPKS